MEKIILLSAWFICFYEFMLYIVSLIVGLVNETEGNKKVDKAYWSQNGRVVRHATSSEKRALEHAINYTGYAGDHEVAYYYNSSSFINCVVVTGLWLLMFKEIPFDKLALPGFWPNLFIALGLSIIITYLHRKVLKVYLNLRKIDPLRKYAIFIMWYKLILALCAISIVFYESTPQLYKSCMLGVLYSWPVINGLFMIMYFRKTKKKKR